MDVSIIIRALNEARHLPALFAAIERQDYADGTIETVLVDSGSDDGSADMAAAFGAKIVTIGRDEFSFGRSLNWGCAEASGEALVFISGHCIPASDDWLARLVAPFALAGIAYCYGRQVGVPASRFSERQLFSKYFPPESRVPQDGFFCSNANAALRKSVWEANLFDEQLTGLEDMDLGKRLSGQGFAIGYVADAAVRHVHDESWKRVRLRFEREAVALRTIRPEIHLSAIDVLRYSSAAVASDAWSALRARCLFRSLPGIILYRLMQYWGAYRGNHLSRAAARAAKESYFYPR